MQPYQLSDKVIFCQRADDQKCNSWQRSDKIEDREPDVSRVKAYICNDETAGLAAVAAIPPSADLCFSYPISRIVKNGSQFWCESEDHIDLFIVVESLQRVGRCAAPIWASNDVPQSESAPGFLREPSRSATISDDRLITNAYQSYQHQGCFVSWHFQRPGPWIAV